MSQPFPPFLHTLFLNNTRVDKRLRNPRFPLFLKHYVSQKLLLVKIAGTNGKGSVSSLLESCCLADGKTVGLFTSPHLECVSERIRINGIAVSLENIESEARILSGQIDKFILHYGENYQLAFFECLLIIGLRLFNQAQVDIAIIEAGVGGYNDACHYLNAPVSAITSIGLDHPQQLGHNLESVAKDKAGIANENSVLILSSVISKPLQTVIKKDCQPRAIQLKISEENISSITQSLNGSCFKYQNLKIDLPLLGEFQLQNFTVVAAVWEYLHTQGIVKHLSSLEGVKNTRWAARMEYFADNPDVLFDVAHNSEAINALKSTLDKLIPKSQRVILCGSSKDKDYRASLAAFSKLSDKIYLCDGFYNAIPVMELQIALPMAKASFQSPEQGLAYLQAHYADTECYIIVAGSVFLTAQARTAYLESKTL